MTLSSLRSAGLLVLVLAMLPIVRAQAPHATIPPEIQALRDRGFHLAIPGLDFMDPKERARLLGWLTLAVDHVARLEGATPARRPRFALTNHREDREHFAPHTPPQDLYPYAPARSTKIGDEPTPLLVIPRAQSLDFMAEREREQFDAALERHRSASALEFTPAALADHLVLACPTPGPDRQGPITNPQLKRFIDVGLLGRAIVRPERVHEVSRALAKADSSLLRRIDVLGLTSDLYLWRQTAGSSDSLEWAIPIADALGAARSSRPTIDPNHFTHFDNQLALEASSHAHPSLPRHVLPRPLPPDDSDMPIWKRPREVWADYRPQERFVLTRPWLSPATPLRVERGPTWEPFMEDILCVPHVSKPADASTILQWILPLDCSALQLIDAIGAYFGVDALPLARTQGWLPRLESEFHSQK